MLLHKEKSYNRLSFIETFYCFHSYTSLDSPPFYRFYNNDDNLDTKICLNNNIFFNGEDPRPFILNNITYVLSQRFVDNFDNIQNYIVNVETGEYQLYKINIPNFSYGKNWTPFVYENELYIIQKFDPFTLIKNGNIIIQFDTNLPKFNNFCEYRGGSNGIEINKGIIVGVGHKTIKYDYHLPFLWVIDFNKNTVEIMDLINYEYTQTLNDPTSLWIDNKTNKIYLSIFESSAFWDICPIYCRSLIYEIDINSCIQKCCTHESYRLFDFNI